MIFLFQQGRPLPKFGEWDVNNPASAEGFTVIFNKARDEKKTKNSPAKVVSPRRTEPVFNKNAKNENYEHPPKVHVLNEPLSSPFSLSLVFVFANSRFLIAQLSSHAEEVALLC
jgi:hypothetical protein